MNKDEARDCDHGRMKGKCDVCDLQAELEATNRQVEILSDALAESRREVAVKDKAIDLALEALRFGLHVGFDESSESQIKKGGKAFDQHNEAIAAIKQARLAPVQTLEHEPENEPYVSLASVREDWGPGPHEVHSLPAQPAQPAPVREPVWIQPDHLQKAKTAPFLCRVEPHKRDDFVPLYTTPPAAQRQWVGLTDEEITDIWAESSPYYHEDDFARAIEAKLKEKNT